jgi:hypothetical protein
MLVFLENDLIFGIDYLRFVRVQTNQKKNKNK